MRQQFKTTLHCISCSFIQHYAKLKLLSLYIEWATNHPTLLSVSLSFVYMQKKFSDYCKSEELRCVILSNTETSLLVSHIYYFNNKFIKTRGRFNRGGGGGGRICMSSTIISCTVGVILGKHNKFHRVVTKGQCEQGPLSSLGYGYRGQWPHPSYFWDYIIFSVLCTLSIPSLTQPLIPS